MGTFPTGLKQRQVEEAVLKMYEEVAAYPNREFHFPTGRNSCLNIGYPVEELDVLPASAVDSFAGAGYPFLADVIKPGDTIVDIGSGSGVDALIAAHKTGSGGQVWGIDISPAMIKKARKTIKQVDLDTDHIRIIKGNADDIPLEDSTADVVISNGVINLVPEKKKAFEEINRVLKPEGDIQIADIVLSEPASEKLKADARLWAECVVGAEPVEDYLDMIRSVGFNNVTVIDRLDYFQRSPDENTRKAAKSLGAHAIVFTGQKASTKTNKT